jgi:hypothetical protein
MGTNTNEWIAGVASYVRGGLGNDLDLVTPADRRACPRRHGWSQDHVDGEGDRVGAARVIPVDQLKVSASVNGATAQNALTLRGWNTGGPQTAGTWLQIELTSPALVTEVAFDSPVDWFGAAGTAARGRAGATPTEAPPILTFPLGYSVASSMDGVTWSKPLAVGKGATARTSVTFAPTRARFLRITETDTAAKRVTLVCHESEDLCGDRSLTAGQWR